MVVSLFIYSLSIYLAWSTTFNMSEIDDSSQDLPSRVTVLENELENLKNNLTQILIHNKNLRKSIQVLTDEIYHNEDILYNNKINCSQLNQYSH